ncbi:hypothetical protein CTAYLR_007391 [Chrysophaeum taylorii]|uniref:ABC transporter domain-containing protein n=1 Tax=Chrysophaeum taylorii TaxID=2483200 RepID=A0AAD7U4Z5_9STRA|nr:hypothetical protein CTAYLR_007391 [Chrysophaeum taylorii]
MTVVFWLALLGGRAGGFLHTSIACAPHATSDAGRAVVMHAKNKGGAKGAAAEALAALAALEDEGGTATATMEPPPPPKKAKKLKKGAAAAAAAALEAIEDVPLAPKGKKAKKAAAAAAAAAALEGEDAGVAVVKDDPPPVVEEEEEEENVGKKADKKAANKAAKAAAAAMLEEMDFDDDDILLATRPKKSKKKKKAQKKEEQEVVAVEEAPEALVATAEVDDGALSLEERKKRERGSARVRLIERAGNGQASLRLEKVSVVFKNTEVLKDATWGVRTGERVGLVGANGGGKSTQLKILAGEVEPTTGEVVMSSDKLNVAFLRQEFAESLDSSKTLVEELSSVFVTEARTLADIARLEKEVGSAEDDDSRMRVLDELGALQEAATKAGAYGIEGKVEKVAIQMGFGDADLDALVASFSGGWKMRIGLAKVLLQQPDVLLLDEPTNHLDLESVEWLEGFLREQTLAMVIVSHDREFLDQVSNKIVDTEDGVTRSYDGCDYTTFLKRKAANRAAWEAAYKKQQAKIQEDKAFINRFRSGSRAQQAKSRERQLEKLLNDPDELVARPPTNKRVLRIRFPEPPRCGVSIVAGHGLTHGYDGRALFSGVDLELQKGDRIAILGPNGAGKSTLLRLLAEIEDPNEGDVEYGSANVRAAYFAQNQADALDLSKTVMKTIEDASIEGNQEYSYNELRALLGQFLFKGDDVEKKLESLSGGEKARVALCAMMLRPVNVLFLDEPTNHLDIPAKETLEDALRNFDGTIVCVSHDRFFISQVANTILTLENGELQRFDGDYASYVEAREDLKAKVGRRQVGEFAIKRAKFVDLEALGKEGSKKKFGGREVGVSGRKDKGVKNAKRSN